MDKISFLFVLYENLAGGKMEHFVINMLRH